MRIVSLKNIALLAFMSLTSTGCIFDSGSKKVAGRFILVWIDMPENQGLGEQSELNSSSSASIIPPYVFAVGHNNRYIIVKQHPTNGFEGGFKMDTSFTNYYVVDMEVKDTMGVRRTTGPLDLKEFSHLRKRLGIEDILFDMTFRDDIYPTISLPDSLKRTPAYY